MANFTPKAEVKKKEKKMDVASCLKLVAKDPNIVVFFLVVFLIGVSSGVVENFAYVRIAEIGGTGKILGNFRLASSLAGAPMFWLSGTLTKLLGVYGVMTLSLLSYTLRFVIYASVKKNPWWALPAEILRGVTFASFWAGAVSILGTAHILLI